MHFFRCDKTESNVIHVDNEIIPRKRNAVTTETLSPKKNKPSSSSSAVQIHSKNCEDETELVCFYKKK